MPKAIRIHTALTSMAALIFSSIILLPSAAKRRSDVGQLTAQSQLRNMMVVTAADHSSTAIVPNRNAAALETIGAEKLGVLFGLFFIYLFNLLKVYVFISFWVKAVPAGCASGFRDSRSVIPGV
jgi:hypothetical protein